MGINALLLPIVLIVRFGKFNIVKKTNVSINYIFVNPSSVVFPLAVRAHISFHWFARLSMASGHFFVFVHHFACLLSPILPLYVRAVYPWRLLNKTTMIMSGSLGCML